MSGLRAGDVVFEGGGVGFGSFDDWGKVIGWCGHVEDGGVH